MASFQSEKLLDRLAADVREILLKTEPLKSLPEAELREKPTADAWSVVEVIAHLNYYARFYVQAMEEQLDGHQTQAQTEFHPGWFGNYFTKSIGPSPDGTVKNKMNTPKDARPQAPAALSPQEEIAEFVAHQHQILNLLQIARTADLGKIRVPISLTRFIRLKLGDTFRFVIAHEQRHFQQIDRVLSVVAEKVKIG
ncbi:DinB family protein [Flavilitoribacter nigricans]|uniref:DinB-like domain-containing protein n=1 Tax=Flavilitoribacter nigricans (strain ATCC 23147 / DSM 23189 / NBRC 102662 / NCIMB 1420 / SS-2) TaxID=1122177 RepID=A0A2D0NFV1_FLAN2|nr:DinB family protein [Flavilitoribacter nigricans]PHN07382.1 hypothetical protein CRP01_07060 [Flavilitoribacter nigricans DSM 23189 = NBRC 102662]